MSPALLENRIAAISPRYREELSSFVDFLLFRQSSENAVSPPVAAESRKSLFGAMKDKNFYMAPDFDAPLEDFAEYMCSKGPAGNTSRPL